MGVDQRRNIQVAISDRFMFALTTLPKKSQKKTLEFVMKFRDNPKSPGINYETIKDAKDAKYRSARVDQAYRAIIRAPDEGGVYLLLWVDKHDDAYVWASKHKCEVHPITGTLQIFESTFESEDKKTTQPDNVVVDEKPDSHRYDLGRAPLFADVSEEDLLGLSVPTESIAKIRQVYSDEQLEALEKMLPRDAYENLFMIAAGTSVEELLCEHTSRNVDTSDIATALNLDSSRQTFWVDPEHEDLVSVLNSPLETWRVYLHPSQRSLVERHWNGPVRVLGGAGTGKTVVAMHRAKWLAKNVLGDDEKLLFTTFTANLAVDIHSQLTKICSFNELQKIQVQHIDGWIADKLRFLSIPKSLVYDGISPAYDDCWSKALNKRDTTLGLPETFYKEEWLRVVQPNHIVEENEYLRISREGRGVALNRVQRAKIWPVFSCLRREMETEGLITFEDAAHLLFSMTTQPEYRCVVIDEAQDMGPESLMLLRQLCMSGRDDVFVVGDGHQRIYRRQAVLGRCGIDIRGRGKKLKLNYRTTEQICGFSKALLEGCHVDDLDNGEDTSSDYRSLTHGAAPQLVQCNTTQSEQQHIVAYIDQLIAQGATDSDICVVARTKKYLETLETFLAQRGFATQFLRNRGDDRKSSGIRMATMHRVKGLEFRHVIIAGCSKGLVPLRRVALSTDDPVEARQLDLSERSLLHVACSRAIQSLYVSWVGECSPYIEHVI